MDRTAFGGGLGEGDRLFDREFGLEQKFFLLEDSGRQSRRADEFLEVCRAMTEARAG